MGITDILVKSLKVFYHYGTLLGQILSVGTADTPESLRMFLGAHLHLCGVSALRWPTCQPGKVIWLTWPLTLTQQTPADKTWPRHCDNWLRHTETYICTDSDLVEVTPVSSCGTKSTMWRKPVLITLDCSDDVWQRVIELLNALLRLVQAMCICVHIYSQITSTNLNITINSAALNWCSAVFQIRQLVIESL